MKRLSLFTLIFGIAALIVAPALQARVMSDDSAGGNAKVLPADVNGGITSTSVTLHTDILGGSGYSAPVPIRTDVLGGTGKPSPGVTWLTNQLRNDPATEKTRSPSDHDTSRRKIERHQAHPFREEQTSG